MSYYKLISGKNIVGAVSLNDFRRYQSKHGIVLFSDIDNAQYVEFKGVYYRDDWLRSVTTDKVRYESVSIVTINEEEYNALFEAFENNEEIEVDPEEAPVEIPPQINEEEQSALEFIRNMKIAQMSKKCHDVIESGIDVILSDGKSHHFSLEIEDQIKIQALAMKAQNGAETLFWHEDNNYCQFYPATDIMAIYSGMETIQIFHTTYFNSLKMYILSLNTISEINAVTYGMEIPVDYQSDVLKYISGAMEQGVS